MADPAAPSQTPPRVFLSYSHDSPEHARRVLTLADRLRAEGIDAILDQYAPWPAEGWPRWMERQIERTDFVLMVCTATYYRRVMGAEQPGQGLGVQWESALIYDALYTTAGQDPRFILVLFAGGDRAHIPAPVRGRTCHCLDTEGGYEGLYRQLTHQPQAAKPALGVLLALPPREQRQDFFDSAPERVAARQSSLGGSLTELLDQLYQ